MFDSRANSIAVHLGLPPIALHWLPECQDLEWPEESLATCERCPLAAPSGHPPNPETPFFHDVQCCVMHANLPSFLAGRALAEGGLSAQRVRARIQQKDDGITPMGLTEGTAWEADRAAYRSPKCPFHRTEGIGCGIHAHRPAACRAWFCQSVEGTRGLTLWAALKEALHCIEEALALRCIQEGTPPQPEDSLESWVAWYRWCADYVHTLPHTTPMPAKLPELKTRLTAAAIQRIMPERLHPSAPPFEFDGDEVLFQTLRGEVARYPRSVFQFLSRLNGQRTWNTAMAEANAAGATLTATQVASMYRAGILCDAKVSQVRPDESPTSPEVNQAFHPNATLADEPAPNRRIITPRDVLFVDDCIHVTEMFGQLFAEAELTDAAEWVPEALEEIAARRQAGAFNVVNDFQQHFSPANPDSHRPFHTRRWIQDPLLDTGHVVHTWKTPPFERMYEWLRRTARALATQLDLPSDELEIDTLWCHITRVGGEMQMHSHGGSSADPIGAFAVVCYLQLDPPDPDHPQSGGVLYVNDGWDQEYYHRPRACTITAVPTAVRHQILPYYGGSERIIVAGNVILPGFVCI